MKQKDLNNLLALGEGFTTGFKRSGVSNLGREYGVAEPRIKVSEHWVTVSFPRKQRQEDQEKLEPSKYPASTQQVQAKSGRDQVKA